MITMHPCDCHFGTGKKLPKGEYANCARCNNTGKYPMRTGIPEATKAALAKPPLRVNDDGSLSEIRKCPQEGCTGEVLEGNVHCAHHYFHLPENEFRKGWEGTYLGGQKFDQDKPRMDLLDAYAIEELSKVLTFGAKKYAPHNWRKGIVLSRLIAASCRHLFAIMRGEDVDEETGLAHAAHLMCCAMFMIWTMKNLPAMDDRWKEPGPSAAEKMENYLKGKNPHE